MIHNDCIVFVIIIYEQMRSMRRLIRLYLGNRRKVILMGPNVLGLILMFIREVGCYMPLGMELVRLLLISKLNRSIYDEHPFIEGSVSFFCQKLFFDEFLVHSLL